MDKTLETKILKYGRAELHKTALKTYRIDIYADRTWLRSHHAVTLSEALHQFKRIK